MSRSPAPSLYSRMALSLPLVRHYVEFVADSLQMTSPSLRGQSPQSPSKHITVVDVYDLAATIGKDFEKIIDLYGNECVQGIMPKVISALETLESLANNNDKENEEVLSLQKTVARLETEKAQRAKQGRKFEEEMELIEETYRKDIAELRGMVKTLQGQNASLSSTVSSLPHNMDSPTTMAMREEDVRMMLELKELSMKQKEEIKQLQKDVEQYTYEVENMENAIGKLIRQNEELLRKNHSLQKQGRMIVEEKIEIMRRLERTEETNIQLRKMLNDTDRVCKDLQQANMLDDEPRFTLSELREVLQEKNVLKGRVLELEEELDNLRPRDKKREFERLDETPEPPPSKGDDDLPVYGPLPKEPEEKLYPWKYERKDSGVRKFFRFFKDLGASPRRGSSATNSPRPSRASISQLAAV